MSRNRDKAIELVFDLVKIHYDLSDPINIPHDFNEERYIYGTKSDSDWLTSSKITSQFVATNDIRFAIVDYDHRLYFITTGLPRPDSLVSGLTEIEINAGLFTVLVSELELNVKSEIKTLALTNEVLAIHTKIEGYSGHDFVVLSKFFPRILSFEIDSTFPGDPQNLHQLIALHLVLNRKYLTLQFKDETLAAVYDSILVNSEISNYESLVNLLLASSYKFAFLSVYRLIEMLYQLVYIDETYTKLSLAISKTAFLETVDQTLKWRPTERTTLQKIMALTPEHYKKDLFTVIKDISSQTNYSEWLYDLRCNIVHLKKIQKNHELKNMQWDNLIKGLIRLLSYWQDKYKNFS